MIIEAQRGSARFHLVNARYDRIGELRCLPTIADVDEPVDVVLLGVPDAAVTDQLAAAAAAGAKSAVLFGSAHGRKDQIAGIAADAGMAVCGAGCMGFVNNALGVRALGYLEPDPLADGGVSLVTHSGSAFSTLLRARRGFGFRLAVSSGHELLHGVPMLKPLPLPAIEQLARGLEPFHVPAGRAVFRQGDPADRFYVIETGAADVLGDGRLLTTLGPGDGFGEIGLLRRVPRTATVRAASDLELQALTCIRFLPVVTGFPPSAREAQSEVEEMLGRFSPDGSTGDENRPRH